ncbi:TonB-dependent siderophore receptor [Duganella sp. FT135W]|uniref:TonB-dependent siderophore receptor n=1 Tax=Duganella flavida TaxID=2692175 RepID=A0A6L8KGH5_9BURK|nr:TonB-dependent receptor [Duganella flavida]MYM24922.1 TonB-dependent siderophore receptor [Duganella flavida]
MKFAPAILLCAAPLYAAAASTQTYNLPAGTLEQSLTALARQASITLLFDPVLVAGKRAPALQRNYTVPQALNILLAAHGLEAQADGEGYTLRLQGGASDTQLPTVTVTGASQENANGPVDGYKARRSATATRLDVALQDQPLSVKVIPAEVLSDLGVRNTTEVADYVAGVARETTAYSPWGQSFYIRGFSTYGSASTLNGFRQDGFLGATDTSAIERIEFLKGPAAVLYGASSAISGVANTVTKRPTMGDFNVAELSAGQWNYGRATLDANHALGSDALLGRVNIAAESSRGYASFAGGRSNRLLAVSPIVTAQIDRDTKVEMELSAVATQYGGRCDSIDPVPELLAISIRKRIVCDRLAHADQSTYSARLEVEHALNSDWSVRVAGFLSHANSNRTEQYALNDPEISADGHTIERYTQYVGAYSSNATSQAELRGKFQLAGATHRLITGVEWNRSYGQYAFFHAAATPFDLINTNYNGAQLGPFQANGPANYNRAIAAAAYVQDFIELGQRWKVLAGLRYDRVRSDNGNAYTRSVDEQQTEHALSPRLGVVYQPWTDTALYASWARSFSPNTGARDINGKMFEAERGVQYELGIKQDLLAQRLNVTAALFNLARSNVLSADPRDPSGNYSIASGRQRARGAELDVVGRLTPAWTVLGAYTYLDAQVVQDNTLAIGSRLVGAARNSGSLWNKLALDQFGLPHWSAGLGVVASGNREAELPNIAIKLGSYVRYDAAAYYVNGPWRAQINLHNLTDKLIYTGQGWSLMPQAPRNVSGSLAYTF